MTTERITLRPMKDLATHAAEWVGHGLMKRHYELRAGDATFATLRWESAVGTRATAEVDGATWTLKRVGFFAPRATVRAAGSETDLAMFRPDWIGNGTVELAGGTHWRWKCLGFWRSRYGFVTSDDQPLIEFQASTLKIPPGAKVVVTPQALALAELPLLIVLGWYVTVLTFDDMGAAAGAAAAAG